MKVIAEIGSNWTNLDDCLYSIRCAKAYGADAVKFQLFDYLSLYGQTNKFITPDEIEIKAYRLNPDWLPQMKEESDHYKIEFMCSAFSPELAEIVNPFVKTHKIASGEMNHVRLLQKVNSFKKPVILSTGAAIEDEISHALTYLPDCDVTLMYCIGAYPARHTLLSNIGLMKEKFKKPIGFSDHSLDVFMNPIGAQLAGAEVIEKHVTFINATTPDSPHSLTGEEFKLMCKGLKAEIFPHLGPTPEEKPMVLRHRRRLIAIKNIKPGDKFVEGENFGIYRSLKDETKALSPFAIEIVIGKVAKNEIKAGDGVGPGDI